MLLVTCFSIAALSAQNVRYVKDAGRQPSDINNQYPYDIGIRTADNDSLNTANIFADNGKPTILLFWLTTCAPCRKEMAAISAKYETWQNEIDFNMYAVSVDWPRNAEAFSQRVKQQNWPFPAYHDFNREFGKILPGRLNGLPQVFVIKNGEIVHHKRKYLPGDEDKLFEVIRNL